MPTPFPGMDPYLEHHSLWPNVHNSLLVAIRDELAVRLRPRYYVAIEERIYQVDMTGMIFAGRPDVMLVRETATPYQSDVATLVPVEIMIVEDVAESYLEIRTVNGDQVVTVLELLSPANKRDGDGRQHYLFKRANIQSSPAHLVEIDLLRGWEPMPLRKQPPPSDYRILISRAGQRPRADLLPFSLRQAIPPFALPLLPGDEEPIVRLNPILHALYDRAGYDLRIDYSKSPDPPFSDEDRAWAMTLMEERR